MNSQVELLKINFYSDNQNVDLVSSPCNPELVYGNFDGRDCQERILDNTDAWRSPSVSERSRHMRLQLVKRNQCWRFDYRGLGSLCEVKMSLTCLERFRPKCRQCLGLTCPTQTLNWFVPFSIRIPCSRTNCWSLDLLPTRWNCLAQPIFTC